MNETKGLATVLIATRNAHKVEEIRAMLGGAFNYLTMVDFPGAPRVIEDAATFVGNATKKSVGLARWLSTQDLRFEISNPCLVLADDSGLEVDALNGAPGVNSARFAALGGAGAGNSSDAENNAKLLRLLKDVDAGRRTARFRCVLALTPVLKPEAESASPVCYADEFELGARTFEGVCEGRIADAPRGDLGFGYDPLFVPEGFDLSFAQLGDAIKNRISHRARALRALHGVLRGTQP